MAHATELSGPDFSVGIPLSELIENVPVLGHAQGEAVLLVRTGSDVHALGATCSHYGGPLAEGLVVGETLRCPWHHACFDLRTGDALGAPALNPIACYEVHRRGDRVMVGPKQSRPEAALPPKSPAMIVIVGAGAAGAAATERLRHLGYRGPITLIGDEAPVDRPNLSKDYLAGTAPEEWVALRTQKFYDKINVDLITDDAVVEVNRGRKTVVLGSGRTLPYDALLLATGAEPVRPPIEGTTLPHVFTLRTLADARGIIEAAKTARRAVVVGSSFIGLEVAASLRARGLEVDVVSRDKLPLERVLGAQLGQFIQELHEERGVRFHLAHELSCDSSGRRRTRRWSYGSPPILSCSASVCDLALGSPRRPDSRSPTESSSIPCCARVLPTSGRQAMWRDTRRRVWERPCASNIGSSPSARAKPSRATCWASGHRFAMCRFSGADITT